MSNPTTELKLKIIRNNQMGLERCIGWAVQSAAAVEEPRLKEPLGIIKCYLTLFYTEAEVYCFYLH